MGALRKVLGRHSDIVMVLLVVGVLVVLFTPIPSLLLDLLILSNISFALLILLLTFYMAKPVEFSTFPSLLLIATLFRLSLNVAATRLILSDADAGKVISAVGGYVVGSNYVIGFIVFLILVVVQYVVVTNGAQRVSEVAARFTLDSMPGQQMSIDADLNMGFIDQDEAKRRRKNIEREAAFYGAMDGASKFVKGDAIAGIIIMLINVIGGLIIGVMQQNMSWGDALKTFTLLTIGDGIVTQVPALVISVGTGIIVTRSASDSNLSIEVLKQVTSFPKVLLLVMVAIAGLMLLPGMPVWPGVVLLVLFGSVAWLLRQRKAGGHDEVADAGAESTDASIEQEAYAALKVEPVEVAVGASLVSMLDAGEQALFMERLAVFRKQYAQEMGLVLPKVRFVDAARLPGSSYEIAIHGTPVARGEILPGQWLAIHAGGDTKGVKGKVTKEPTYGLPAVWIEAAEREAAKAAKFTLVDAPTVFMTHLCEVLRMQSPALLTRHETERMMSAVRQYQAALVDELIPVVLSLGDVQKVLQTLLREKVSIRNLEAILETLADAGKTVKDPVQLTELVRQRLGGAICHGLVSDGNALHVLTLAPDLEQSLTQGLRTGESGGMIVVDPKLTEQVMVKLAQQAERMMKSNLLPVVLCSPELRRHLRAMSERMMPHMRVLSLLEIPGSLELRSFGTVSLQ